MFNLSNPFKQGKCPEEDYCFYFFTLLFEKAISFIKWDGKLFYGFNAPLNSDYIEFILHTQGFGGFTHDKSEIPRALRCSPIGYDPYLFPEQLQFANAKLGSFRRSVGSEAVFIRNNKFATPSILKISHFAKQLARIQLSLDISLKNNRMTKIFCADDDPQAQQIRRFIDDISTGKEAVLVKKNILSEIFDENHNIPVYGTPSEYLADQYIQNLRSVMSDFFVTFGVNASGANQIKKERNTNLEVDSNNQEIEINRAYFLEPRKQAAKLASELFGSEITVEIRQPDPIQFENSEVEENEN